MILMLKINYLLFYKTLFIENGKFINSVNIDVLNIYDICLKEKEVNNEEKKLFLDYIEEEKDEFSINYTTKKNVPTKII